MEAVHDWVQKADLQPANDASLNQIMVDETVFRIQRKQYWLDAIVYPNPNFRIYGFFDQ